MKTLIVAMWALVATASTDYVRDKRDIGISSGYGGTFGYAPAPNAASVSKYLQSSAQQIVIPKQILLANVAISNGYGGAYDYTSTPIDNNRDMPSSVAISSGYGGAYGYVPNVPTKLINPNKILKPSVPVASAYGGAFGYGYSGSVGNDNNKLKSNVAISNGYSLTLSRNAMNVKSHLQPDIAISSGYGGAYGYAPSRVVDVNRNMPSTSAISESYGAYGCSPTSTISVNDVNEQKMDMLQVMGTDKMMSVPQLIPKYLPGFSGYGNMISSYSGYSRYPDHPGYGFAYANGWL